MHRTTLIALLAAAVLGMAGGSLVAIGRTTPDQTSGTPSAGPSTTPSALPSDTPSGPASRTPSSDPSPQPTASGDAGPGALLYADARKIYDGQRTVSYDTPFGIPDRLVRTAWGYLLSRPTSMEDRSSLLLYAVASDGGTRKVTEVIGGWDLDPGGTRIVGTDVNSGRLRVWDLTGRVLATAKRPVPRSVDLDPVWIGDTVVLSGRIVDDQIPAWHVWRWDPDDDSADLTNDVGLVNPAGSADGTLVAGSVGIEGLPVDEDNVDEDNFCLKVTSYTDGPRNGWQTCDWRRDAPYGAFSPDGTRMLAIPADSDGFGPGEFATFSASEGPSGGLTRIEAPDMTVNAQWLDNEHLVLRSRTDADIDENTGTVLHRCDLRGSCQEIVRRNRGELVLGEQY